MDHWPTTLGEELIRFYELLYSSDQPVFPSTLDRVISPKISDSDNDFLTTIPDRDEIFATLRKMSHEKSSGLNSMTVLFYKYFWYIVGDVVISTVQDFFLPDQLNPEINRTYLDLIPKVDNASKVAQFGLISLCNVIYKLISKILTERLKPLMSRLISPYQLAFVPRRVIHDNYVIAAELFHAMGHKSGHGGRMVVKADMENAYDRVEWSIRLQILENSGFNSKWISWIKICLSTSRFSAILNEAPSGDFSPSRGLRQSDPISPFLFIMCSEVLSRLLLKSKSDGQLRGIKVGRGAPIMSHLLFADDLLIFARAKRQDATAITACLDKYMSWFGQNTWFKLSGSTVPGYSRLSWS